MSETTAAPRPAAPEPVVGGPVSRRLRLWPGLVLAALLVVFLVPARLAPASLGAFLLMFWGPTVVGLGLVGWWLFASRLGWGDRLLIVATFALAGGLTWLVAHHSMPIGLYCFAFPAAVWARVGWLLVTASLPWGTTRRLGLVVVIVLAWAPFTLLRLDGGDAALLPELGWRWTLTEGDRHLAELAEREKGTAAGSPVLRPGDWPGFRGPNRDGRLVGVKVGTDWASSPPKLLWKQRIGPGWSSFAVVGKHLYTQEQRDNSEAVVCYDADTGKERWVRERDVRFYEAIAGAGPRATPTFHDGKLYALGARGHLDCLDAGTGARIWQRDITKDSGAKVPPWGFASSPLVAHGLVTVYAGGEDRGVVAYRADTGKFAWAAGRGAHGYCSTQLTKVGGVEQLLVAHGDGVTALGPKDGTVLWEHEWRGTKNLARVTQLAQVGERDLLVGTYFGLGTRRLRLQRDGTNWQDEEVWTTKAIRPYFNDLVVHDGHLYGFDATFFVCVELEEGKEKWRARGYGNGQVLLLVDQGLLLILSERGEVALVEANPEGHVRPARMAALRGKTWNHPVIAHGRLYVRNGAEMACFELPR